MSFDNYKEYRLGNVCTKIGSGATPKGGKESYLPTGDFALIRSQNVLDFFFSYDGLAYINEKQASNLNNVKVEKKDVLLNITGDSVARVCQVPEDILPARVNQHVAILRPQRDKVDSTYLKYYLLNTSFKNYMLALSSIGGTRNALTKLMIEEFKIYVPSLTLQHRIASILSSLDEKIELNHQTNKTLENIAEAIFKEWFVDFNFPGSTKKMYKTEEGQIPVGWKVNKLKEVALAVTGKTPSSSNPDHFGDYLPFITPTDFKNYNKLIIHSDRYISSKGASSLKNKILPIDSVLVTCIGSDMGKVAISKISCLTNQQINSLIPQKEVMTSDYLYHHLLEKYDLLRSMASAGSTMPIINKSQFEDIKIIVPPLELLNSFKKLMDSLNDLILNNIRSIQTLTQLRDTLLPKLMKGEIPIPEI